MTFWRWLRSQKDRQDDVGDLARSVLQDACAPKRRRTLPAWSAYLALDWHHALHRAFAEWRQSISASPHAPLLWTPDDGYFWWQPHEEGVVGYPVQVLDGQLYRIGAVRSSSPDWHLCHGTFLRMVVPDEQVEEQIRIYRKTRKMGDLLNSAEFVIGWLDKEIEGR